MLRFRGKPVSLLVRRICGARFSATEDVLSRRGYCQTSILWEDAAPQKDDKKLAHKLAARDFNNRRAEYRRQVSLLRKEYAKEVAEQRAADKAEQEALERELTRRRLERQHRKNIRSAQNAMRQKELREQRAKEFEEHLRLMQQKRDAKNERYARARQMVIDELEEEAPLWLTTPEEVEAAFTPEAEQLLWARTGGILGAPNPSLDCHFWQYETHTWHMDRTYKSQRQILLEEIEDQAYEEANIDDSFWTSERLEEQTRLEEKARLRAMVHSAGRTALLRRQRQMLDEQFATEEGEIPKPAPAPNLRVLRNDKALEREGAELLMEDPTKFFVFEKSTSEGGMESQTDDSSSYSGPTLGAPVALRDPLREGSHQNRVFPQGVGKFPKPDIRTEREKKQQEREERMFAAAQAEALSGEMDIENAAEERTAEDLEPDIDYDTLEWDSDDEEWKKGLDPTTDSEILETPRERRYNEDDIDWVLSQLQGKVKFYERQFSQDMENLQQQMKSKIQLEMEEEGKEALSEGNLDDVLLSMSDKELFALSDLDERYSEGMTTEEFSEAAKSIPSLTEDEIKFLLERGGGSPPEEEES